MRLLDAFEGLGELVGAGGGFLAAADTFEFGDDIFYFHTFHKGSNALQVAVTSTGEDDIFYNAIFYFEINYA